MLFLSYFLNMLCVVLQNDNLRAQMAALKRNEVQNQRDAERRIEQWRLQVI